MPNRQLRFLLEFHSQLGQVMKMRFLKNTSFVVLIVTLLISLGCDQKQKAARPDELQASSAVTVTQDQEVCFSPVQSKKKPCGNPLSHISIKKFGYRKDERRKTVMRMLRDVRKVVRDEKNFTIASDRWSEYRHWVSKELPFADYQNHSGQALKIRERSLANYEDGILEDFSLAPDPGLWWNKKQKNGKTVTKAFDPLFRINQKCAVLRSRISRLRKRFWGFTQEIKYLEHHLWLFIAVNNGYEIS